MGSSHMFEDERNTMEKGRRCNCTTLSARLDAVAKECRKLKEFLATVEAIANDPDYSSPELMVRHIRAAIAAAKGGDDGKV